MATARDIVTRALKRAAIIASDETPSAADATDTLAALNDMMQAWAAQGVDTKHTDFALGDTFRFFVPPKPVQTDGFAPGRIAAALHALTLKGGWDADANSPALASSVGTTGDLYTVTTAGSTVLDGVTTWAVGDRAVFDGLEWLKGQSSRQFENGVIAMLAARAADDFGTAVSDSTLAAADAGWRAILAAFCVPGAPVFDKGVANMPSQRYVDYY